MNTTKRTIYYMQQLYKLTILILSLIPVSVFADDDPHIQYLPEYMPQAPNAQAIARAIDIPVNYYTGQPNISIPIYNVRVGSITVPITLSYQGGGIRPSQEATCVGLGWRLNAGGAITRTIKCADDFMEHKSSDSQFVYGFFDKTEWLNEAVIDGNYYRSIISQGNFNDAFRQYYLCTDSEPDVFFYSIPSCSGKFSFKKDKSIVFFDKSDNIQISPPFGNNSHAFFYAIDSQGTAYCFETKERTHVYSALGGKNVNTTKTGVDITSAGTDYLKETADYTSTWYLTQMISSTNDTVGFEYENEDYQLPLQENCRYQRKIGGAYAEGDADGPIYTINKTELESKRLTKITWRGGYVVFEYGKPREDLIRASITTFDAADSSKPLTDIKVYDINNFLVRHWRMSYDYFNSTAPDIQPNRRHLFKRLRLNTVKDMLTEQEPYSFCYYDSIPMPVKNTKNLDFWGYYNGVSQGEQYYCQTKNISYGSNKYPDERYCKIGMLEAIRHPTGGTTYLHWESNKAGERASGNHVAGSIRGGLRIGSIKGRINIKYLYETGKELIQPCTSYREKHVYLYESHSATYEIQPSEPVRPLSTWKNGNIIGYSKVTEIFADNSKIEYTFHNEEEELEDPTFPYSPSHTDWMNGILLTTIHFDTQGDTVSKITDSYTQILTEELYKVGFIEVRPGYIFNYYNKVACPKLSHSTITEYRDNGIYATKHSFIYNDNLLCKEEKTQIGSDYETKIYKYAGDFSDAVSQKMVESNMTGVPVAQISLRNGNVYDGARTVYGNFNELTGNTVICGTRTWNDTKFCEMYLPAHLLTVNTANTAGGFADCKFDTAIVYNSYTRYGNVCELSYKGMPVTYIWAYQGMYPIAEFKNATYRQFLSIYGNTNLDTTKDIYLDPEYIRDKMWQVGKSFNDVSVSINFYKPLTGVREMTDCRGIIHSYDYDQAGRMTCEHIYNIDACSPEQLLNNSYAKNTVTSVRFPTTDTSNGIKSIQYYDEWGRQSVYASQGAQQDGAFSYSMQTYDNLGREYQAYIPVPGNSKTGEQLTVNDFKALSAGVFSNDSYGYVQNTHDALGRTIETTFPGKEWHGKSTTCQYLTNTAGEVRKYAVSANTFTENSFYDAGTLDCKVTTDPDGITVKTYKDIFGNTVLERKAGNLDTYYIYDNFNRLRFVLPPKYQDEQNTGYYAYQYEYDGKGRVTKKTLPGCSPVRYWYDNADRIIKMQDGVLLQSNKYRVWKYDGLGRQISQGIEHGGQTLYYETLCFYDGYDFISTYSSLMPKTIGNILPNTLYTKCQPTGIWQQAGNGEPMLTVFGYNEYGHVIKKTEAGIGGRLTVYGYTTNLAGDITEERFCEYKDVTAGNSAEKILSGTIENNYGYKHTPLLSTSVISLFDSNGNTLRTDTIQNLAYDKFGRIMRNDRGGTAADMAYEYDLMRGWLKRINSGGTFEQKLYYENGATPRWNGSISAVTWKTDNAYVRRFDYEYDPANRLKRADFSYYTIGKTADKDPVLSLIPSVGMENEDYTSEYYYDKNGNLTGAYRQGLVADYEEGLFYDTLDDYVVSYRGNQRISADGTGVGTPAYFDSSYFVDGIFETGEDEYAYNENGAMTMDLNKGITAIEYDLPGNIKKISMTDNRCIQYVYAADGTRLRTIHSQKKGAAVLKDSTDYHGNLILKNGTASMYLFAGGYISFKNNIPDACHYYIEDYQGNNRMVVGQNNKTEQVTHYYPYGGVIGGIARNAALQQYKFEGKELDRTYGLDWYDIHARQYDPIVPSWHTVDPMAEKYYDVSPYAYCGNNPVNAVDPDGKEIVIAGSRQQRIFILTQMQKLSNDKLGVMQNGKVVIMRHGTKNTAKNLSIGTSLISNIINNDHTMTITLGERNREKSEYRLDAINGKGSNSAIEYNNHELPYVLTINKKTGKIQEEGMFSHIVLGHEMIHGYRTMEGNAKAQTETADYQYVDEKGNKWNVRNESVEELETVGIIGDSKYTENKLREEQNINQRIKY